MKLGLLTHAVILLIVTALQAPACMAQSPVITLDKVETPVVALSTVDQLQDAFVTVANKVKPSVVTIYAERLPLARGNGNSNDADPAPRTPDTIIPSVPDDSQTSLGSGMVIDNQGHILTNYHVVKDAVSIRVIGDTSSDSPIRPIAKLIGYDEESDLAVLQVKTASSFQPVEFGDSDSARIGEWVLAVGAPFDQAQTVTVGVISAKGRHLTTDGQRSLQDYLQTDASINPGNSGGPLVNMQGKVIGVNTAILSPSRYSVGIGFAVPSATISRLLPQLLRGEHVERGFLGIRYLPLSPTVADAFGLAGGMQIGALASQDNKPFGPAYEAGLRQGDIIISVNDQAVLTSESFRQFVSTLAPGTVVKLEIVRPLQKSTQHLTFEITLGDRSDGVKLTPPVAPLTFNLPQFGLQIENTRDLTPSQRSLLEQPPTDKDREENQVIITTVRPGSSADDALLRQGETIEKINVLNSSATAGEGLGIWHDITNKSQLIKLVQDLLPQARVLLQVQDKQQILIYRIVIVSSPEMS